MSEVEGRWDLLWHLKAWKKKQPHTHTRTFVWSHLTPNNLLSSFLVFGRWFPGGRSVIPCKVIEHSTTTHSLGVTSAWTAQITEELMQKHRQDELCCSFNSSLKILACVLHPPEDTYHLETGNLTCNQLMDETRVKVLPARCSHPRTVNAKTRHTEQAQCSQYLR